jgi:hypothetical protein
VYQRLQQHDRRELRAPKGEEEGETEHIQIHIGHKKEKGKKKEERIKAREWE